MAIGLSLALFAAAEGAAATDVSSQRGRAADAAPVASARATARIVRPVRVRIRRDGERPVVDAPRQQEPQEQRDENGTLWIEFS